MISTRGTQAFFVYLCAFALVTLAYFSTASSIVGEWSYNSPYSHGILALALSFWIVWEKRDRLELSSQIQWLALLAILLASALWLVGVVSNTFLFTSVGMLGVIVGACWQLFSWRGMWRLAPALGAIFLVLPIWGPLQWPLQKLSIVVTGYVLDLVGVPTLREGIYFTVPGGKFAVEPACSGLGFLLCSVLLGIVYAHFNQLSVFKTIRLMVFAVLLALVSNWVRIIIIMLVGNATNMDHPIVTDHLMFGWVVFAVALVPFYWVANLGSEVVRKPQGEEAVLPLSDKVPAFVVLSVIIVALPLCSYLLTRANQSAVGESEWVFAAFDAELKNGRPSGATTLNPTFVGASEISQRHYTLAGQPLGLLVVRYDQQRQGQELVFVENSIYDKDRWQIDLASTEAVPPGIDVDLLDLIGNGNRRRHVYSWYIIGSQMTSSPLLAKLFEITAFFQRQPIAYQVAIVVDRPTATSTGEVHDLIARVTSKLESEIR